MDWSKERASTNLCGYCTGFSNQCNGDCFTRPDWDTAANKLNHLHEQVTQAIPKQKKALQERLEMLIEAYIELQKK